MVKKIVLRIKKEECKDTCPIPLELIPNVEKSIFKIDYDETKQEALVEFDEMLISVKEIITKLKKIGYEVIE